MYNKLVCALSGQTLHADNNTILTLLFNAVSIGSEVGKVVTPFPFIIDFNFQSSKLEANTKEDQKEFRRFVYYFLNNYKLEIKNISTSEITKFSFANSKQRPSKEDIDFVSHAILSFPCDEYEIFFKAYNMEFSLTPFVSSKKQFDIIKDNDFSINYNFKNKDDLVAWQLKSSIYNPHLRNITEGKTKSEINNIAIQRVLRKNKFDLYKEDVLKESLFFSISIFKYVGINGIRKKSINSIEKMFDTYWAIYKLTEMNININQTSVTYPNNRINDDLIKYHEKRLEVLRQELNK